MVGWPVWWPVQWAAGELNTGRGRIIGHCAVLLIVLPRSDKIETELFYWGKLPTLTTHNRYLVAHWLQPQSRHSTHSAIDVWEIEFLAVCNIQSMRFVYGCDVIIIWLSVAVETGDWRIEEAHLDAGYQPPPPPLSQSPPSWHCWCTVGTLVTTEQSRGESVYRKWH